MDLKLVSTHSDETTIYENCLENALSAISAKLFLEDVWDKKFVESIPLFVNKHVSARSPIDFEGMPNLLTLELKLHWARLLADPRMDSRGITERRRLPMEWLKFEGHTVLKSYEAECLAQIPHPEFPREGRTKSINKRKHNEQLLDAFSQYGKNLKRKKVERQFISGGKVTEQSYLSPRITVVGDIHKKVIIQKEQFRPIHKRNIVFLNDLYSEDNTRFKDLQRTNDRYLNFYLFPDWIRAAIRVHVLQKVEYGELSPKTLETYFRRLERFRDFMHERFTSPTPADITNNLIESEFVAWGNLQGFAGKNWFTDALAMLNTASRTWPDTWPSVSVSNRAASKIEKVHYKKGLGRMGQIQEASGRSYSQRIVDDVRSSVIALPSPIPCIFLIILSTGMRAEDGHAILFDCLSNDPTDEQFVLFTFWQNKVSKWNVKPLHKKNHDHLEVIRAITEQKERVVKKYGRPTKYLFPAFNGSHESFCSPSYSLDVIRKSCLENNVLADNGEPLLFSWHPLRHTKGTSLALGGHDVLSIMMELGHASPDMATTYINNRLELKKKALLESGSGLFYTIEGTVDEKISELLVRKDQINTTRVCGGACSMPAQIGDWCEHANACYTCKHYRADAKDIEFFKIEHASLINLIDVQQEEASALKDAGRERMSAITQRRLKKNKEVCDSLEKIVNAIEGEGIYSGTEQKFKQLSLEVDK